MKFFVWRHPSDYLRSLQTILNKETTKQEKICAFEEQGIEIDDKLESGVSDMCNYGSYVAASSERKGLIKGSIETLREMNVSEREIAEKIKAKYNLTDEEVDEYLCVKS